MNKLFHLIIFSIQIGLLLTKGPNKKRDAKLSTPELIKAYGYPSEVHNVVTEDGYILETHRIANPDKQPVILNHGVLDSSATWVILGPKHSLGFILYDQNYDVWLLNARGNDFSTGHIKYQRNGKRRERKKYWNFSWHEMGKYDLPAIIDYVLANTSYSKVHYIGHSQGTTTFFVLTSERPEYNSKILLMAAMAPTVFLTHVYKSLTPLITPFRTLITIFGDWLISRGITTEFTNIFVELQNSIFCSLDIIRNTQLCKNNFSPIAGNLTEHVNKSMIPVLRAQVPAGASFKTLLHIAQLIQSPQFHQYDYAPVIIIYSDHDTLVSARDVRRLPNELSNVLAVHRVDDDTFNHLDFVWAMDAKELVYDYILDWMRVEEQRQNSNDT